MPPVRLLCEERQGGSDQSVGLAKRLRRRFDVLGQPNVARPRHQKTEGHGLGVAVSELVVVRLGKQQLAPIDLQAGQARLVARELLGDLGAQEAAKPGRGFRELPRFRGLESDSSRRTWRKDRAARFRLSAPFRRSVYPHCMQTDETRLPSRHSVNPLPSVYRMFGSDFNFSHWRRSADLAGNAVGSEPFPGALTSMKPINPSRVTA